VYSESVELDEEVRRSARERAEDPGVTAQQVYLRQMDPKLVEEKLRSEPEMQRRMAAATGYYDIRYRLDNAYAKVNIRWTELSGYSREDGKFEAERPRGQSSAPGSKMPSQAGVPLTGRTKLEPLKPGAYRIAIEGETTAGQKVRIDERDYWFDGKTFEEL
jgi:hypothetical protein